MELKFELEIVILHEKGIIESELQKRSCSVAIAVSLDSEDCYEVHGSLLSFFEQLAGHSMWLWNA